MTESVPLQGTDSQVHLWLTEPGKINDVDLLERYETLLGPQETASYQELINPHYQREYLISQALLRSVLGYYAECEPAALEFERNNSGKPALKNAAATLKDLSFNLSHSAGSIVCAVTRAGPVGVDVEAWTDDSNSSSGTSIAGSMVDVADSYFSQREIEHLQQLPDSAQQQQFCKIWTLKEAYVKARGEGLALPLDQFGFECADGGDISLFEEGKLNPGWQFWSLQPLPGYRTAVAVAASNCTLRLFSSVPLQETCELTLDALGQVA